MNDQTGWVVRHHDGKTTITHNGKKVLATHMSIDFQQDGQSYLTLCVRLAGEDVIDAVFSDQQVVTEKPEAERYIRNPGTDKKIWSVGSSLDRTVYWTVDREACVVEIFDRLVEDSFYDTDISFGMIKDSVSRLVETGFLWKV